MSGRAASCNKNCKWIYRIWANPGMPRGGVLPPIPVLAPGSALGSRPRVALSTAQAPRSYLRLWPVGNSRLARRYITAVLDRFARGGPVELAGDNTVTGHPG